VPGTNRLGERIGGLGTEDFLVGIHQCLKPTFQTGGLCFQQLRQPFPARGRPRRFACLRVHKTAAGVEHGIQIMQDSKCLAGVFLVNRADVFGFAVLVADNAGVDGFRGG
jgi:hypothetical protein